MKRDSIIFISFGLIIAALVFSCCSSPDSRAAADRGSKIYTQYCLACHQADGSGVPQLNPPLKNTDYVLGDESRLIGIVMNGLSEGVEINGDTYTNSMPPFGAVLKDEEIADVLTYVRNSFNNKESKISVEQVKALRK
jgi:mono/diheme cytochrome c family protein